MRKLTLKETHQISAAALNINGVQFNVPNDVNIPADQYQMIENTFQEIIDGKVKVYQGMETLKAAHICKYDVTYYFNSLLSTLASRG